MGMWLYPDSTEQLIWHLLSQIHTILPISYEGSLKSQANFEIYFSTYNVSFNLAILVIFIQKQINLHFYCDFTTYVALESAINTRIFTIMLRFTRFFWE
jgi:hypothetical protein